jgi:hypothetical protein
MASFPQPDRFKGSGAPARAVRQGSDGHRGVNIFTDEDKAADLQWRANEKSFDEADFGVDDYSA